MQRRASTLALATLRLAPLLWPLAAAAQGEPLRIGFLTVRTGPLAAGGRQMEQGIQLLLFGGVPSADNQRFVRAVQPEYKVTPGFYTAGTYTAGLWLEAALKKIGGRFEDKPAFVRALHEARLTSGPMGPIHLDAYGKPVLNIHVRKVERKDGQSRPFPR